MSDTEKNSQLWESVEKTDRNFTKTVAQRGGYTSICPQYQLGEATKVFGPYGKGFGLSVSKLDMALFESIGLVVHNAVFFYVLDGERCEFPINNAIEAKKTTKNGPYVDVDFAKKVETNTVSKALSKLGFNADVFMGLFDDVEYLRELDAELSVKNADQQDKEIEQKILEHEQWKEKELSCYEHLKTAVALNTAYTGHIRRCQRRNDTAGVNAFTKAFEARMAQIGAVNNG
jgi:hypothetical protein